MAENIKLIDVIKEINFRKNKLLVGASEPALKSLRIGRETEAGSVPRTGSSRCLNGPSGIEYVVKQDQINQIISKVSALHID